MTFRTTYSKYALILIFLLSGLVCLNANTRAVGNFSFEHPQTGQSIRVFFVRSSEYNPKQPPVIVFHGMKRNADVYRDGWIELAEKHRFFVLVPEFTEAHYPGTVGYNLGNVFRSETDLTRRPESDWSYHLPEIVFEKLKEQGTTDAKGYLAFGHSAGSQFLHRKIAFVPDQRLLLGIAANAGWYTLPDTDEMWPYGYAGTGFSSQDLEPYLASKLFLLLGDQDTNPKASSLRRTPEAMRQGNHRLERGHHFFNLAKSIANQRSLPFAWKLQEVPGVGHNGAKMAPAAAQIMADYINTATP